MKFIENPDLAYENGNNIDNKNIPTEI